MNQIIHILKHKLLIFLRLESKITLANIVKNFASGLTYAAFAVGAFLLAQRFIWFLLVRIKLGLFLFHEFISITLFIFFLSVNVGNIIVAYSTLYKSSEVSFFLTKPVSPTKIFFIKYLDNFFYSSSTLLLILYASLIGYAYYFKLSPPQFVLLAADYFFFIFSASALGVIVLLIFVRLSHRFGWRKIVYGLAIAYSAVILIFFAVNSPGTLVNTVIKLGFAVDRDRYYGELISPILTFLPNHWLSQTGYNIITGNLGGAWKLTLMQLGLSLILFVSVMFLGSRWYLSSWLSNQNVKTKKQLASGKINQLVSFGKKSGFLPQTESIIKRDVLVFLREPTQVIHFLVLLFLIIIFVANVTRTEFIGTGNFYLQTIIYLATFTFNLLLVTTLSLRFIFPLISLEGLAFWKIKSAPVNTDFLLKKKISVIGTIIIFISISLGVITNLKFGLLVTSFALLTTILAALSIISINLGMGGLFANFKEKNAIRLASSQGATLSFLLSVLYIVFLIVIVFKPLSELFLSVTVLKPLSADQFFWLIIPISVASLIIVLVFQKMAYKSLLKDF
ncbi:MAG: hypothetical protein AB1775_04070 [Bacteroidota bacterium]